MPTPPLLLATLNVPEPIGTVSIVSDGERVYALDFGEPEQRLMRLLRARFGAGVSLAGTAAANCRFTTAVRAYFKGDFAALEGLPVDGGGSAFQQRVWAALRDIPAGTTRSYGELAAQLNNPGAARAVGLANALNPINLIVPCHRIIGGSGALTGYGGGINRKRWLLDFERGAAAGTQIALL